MEDNSISYELFIRGAHQCGRFGTAGANADIFKELQRSYQIYTSEKKAIKEKKERIWATSEEKMLIEYMIKVGEVSAYIKTALFNIKKKYKTNLTDKQYNELENLESLLISPDIDKINTVIDKAGNLMVEINLLAP